MKIAYIAAGAAGMYCGSCLHDNTLAAALLKRGEDVVLVPTYTPLRTDEADVSLHQVFFGGINVYLQQKVPLFRYTPWWFDRVFDHPRVLKLISGKASSVEPKKLGDLTLSMLQGEDGNQKKELRKLVRWLLTEVQPDVVHLSNSMLLGMARMIDEECGPPVVCSVSGEDSFLEQLEPPYYEQVRELLRERAGDAHALVAMNQYYADHMREYLSYDRGPVRVIPHGLNLDEQTPAKDAIDANQPLAIGYLARICPEKGLHLLVEACELLAQREAVPPFQLHVAGYLGSGHKRYLREIEQRIAEGPLAGRYRYFGEVDRPGKNKFLQSLHVFSTPTTFPEGKGLPMLEALSHGVPVVMPAHGSFVEMVEDTGGGLLCEPNNAAHLADQLADLLGNRTKAAKLGEAGQRAIRSRYTADQMAQQTVDLYQQLIDSHL